MMSIRSTVVRQKSLLRSSLSFGENSRWPWRSYLVFSVHSTATVIAEDMLAVLKLAKDSHRYPGDLGFEPEIKAIWRLWRSEQTP
jgi:hypothetical protein